MQTHVSENFTSEFPVDLVYTWVDGSDQDWWDGKCRYQVGPSDIPQRYPVHETTAHARDELYYLVHLALLNAPWLRYIWIVTHRPQRPSWLFDDPIGTRGRIRVIHHDACMPQVDLPTYNSLAIECYLSRIPGLAEHWLYSNDDTMILRLVQVNDFFDEERRPVFRTVLGTDRRRRLAKHRAASAAR